ncbi:hypothetical protein EVAR_45715_1 [Eumeta japonica]|uniref:Uncharacterized protein n=1 Tax=Eumeta variegata TaxID=151549 RepID=A0A4C1WWW3_EUMVA|nr:hypothetical protein EVAR_45715_1 [Eumeta japonica]
MSRQAIREWMVTDTHGRSQTQKSHRGKVFPVPIVYSNRVGGLRRPGFCTGPCYRPTARPLYGRDKGNNEEERAGPALDLNAFNILTRSDISAEAGVEVKRYLIICAVCAGDALELYISASCRLVRRVVDIYGATRPGLCFGSEGFAKFSRRQASETLTRPLPLRVVSSSEIQGRGGAREASLRRRDAGKIAG